VVPVVEGDERGATFLRSCDGCFPRVGHVSVVQYEREIGFVARLPAVEVLIVVGLFG
jgi:hypothetical protein